MLFLLYCCQLENVLQTDRQTDSSGYRVATATKNGKSANICCRFGFLCYYWSCNKNNVNVKYSGNVQVRSTYGGKMLWKVCVIVTPCTNLIIRNSVESNRVWTTTNFLANIIGKDDETLDDEHCHTSQWSRVKFFFFMVKSQQWHVKIFKCFVWHICSYIFLRLTRLITMMSQPNYIEVLSL